MSMQSEKGFTLITVIMLLVIALTLVVVISDRFIKTTHMTLGTDAQARASAVAEAAMERILLKDNPTLSGYITNNNCGSDCSLVISLPDGSSASAVVSLSLLGGSSSAYSLNLGVSGSGNTLLSGEVNLLNYGNSKNLDVCWNSNFSGFEAPSVYAIYVSGLSASYSADSYSVNSANSTNISNGFSTATPANGYANCFTVVGKANPRMLRLRALYNNVTLYIIPSSGQTLPTQGIRLTSIGTFGDATKKVVVTKSEATVPLDFDYVLLQKSTTDPLSN